MRMADKEMERVARPHWDRDETQAYPHQGYYEGAKRYPECMFTTMNGTRCANGGAASIFRNTANPSLANFAVCRRHMDELFADIYRAVMDGGSGKDSSRPSQLARVVAEAESERVKRARRRVRQVEHEIQQVVNMRISAPVFDPRKAIQ